MEEIVYFRKVEKNTHIWKFCKGVKMAKWQNMANFGDEI